MTAYKPYCIAMILCDHVHRDPATGKHSILGTFSTVGASSYPTGVQLTIYFALTDTFGQHDVSFRLVKADDLFNPDAMPLFEVGVQINTDDANAVVEGFIPLRGPIPEPGVYHCELYLGDGEVLMSRRLVALTLEDSQ